MAVSIFWLPFLSHPFIVHSLNKSVFRDLLCAEPSSRSCIQICRGVGNLNLSQLKEWEPVWTKSLAVSGEASEVRQEGAVFSQIIQSPFSFLYLLSFTHWRAKREWLQELRGHWQTVLCPRLHLEYQWQLWEKSVSEHSRNRNWILDCLLRGPCQLLAPKLVLALGWICGSWGPDTLLSSAARIDLRGSFVSSSQWKSLLLLPLSPSAFQALPLCSSASNELKISESCHHGSGT